MDEFRRIRSIGRDLTPVERGTLEARATALSDALAPVRDEEMDDAKALIGALFTNIRSMRQSGDDSGAIVEITFGVLRKYSLWAIKAACMEIADIGFMRDEKREKHWAPNTSEIADIVRAKIKDYEENLANAQVMLAAPVVAPLQLPGPEKSRPTRADLEAKYPELRLSPSGVPSGRHPTIKAWSEFDWGAEKRRSDLREDLARRRARNEQGGQNSTGEHHVDQ